MSDKEDSDDDISISLSSSDSDDSNGDSSGSESGGGGGFFDFKKRTFKGNTPQVKQKKVVAKRPLASSSLQESSSDHNKKQKASNNDGKNLKLPPEKKKAKDIFHIESSDDDQDSDSDDDDDDNGKQNVIKKDYKPEVVLLDSDSDSDSDSDLEVMTGSSSRKQVSTSSLATRNGGTYARKVSVPSNTNDNSEASKVLQKAREARQALIIAQNKKTIDFDADADDNDDDDDDIAIVDNPSNVIPNSSYTTTSSSLLKAITIKAYTLIKSAPKKHQIHSNRNFNGKISELTLRKTLVSNNNKSYIIKDIMDQYYQLHSPTIQSPFGMQFLFRGTELNRYSTLDSYGLKDKDMVDVYITIRDEGKEPNLNSMASFSSSSSGPLMGGSIPFTTRTTQNTTIRRPLPTTTKTTTTLTNVSDIITIQTRIKNGNPQIVQTYQIPKTSPLEKILQLHRTKYNYSSFKPVFLELDGRRLSHSDLMDSLVSRGISRSDHSGGGGGGGGSSSRCRIQIVDEALRLKQMSQMPEQSSSTYSTTTTSSSSSLLSSNKRYGDEIELKFRINGNEKSIHTLTIRPKQKFQIIMDKFFRKNSVTDQDGCKFQFDGERLNPMGSPDDEDLEGGEMIDVQIPQGVLERVKRMGGSCSANGTTRSGIVLGNYSSTTTSASARTKNAGATLASTDNEKRIKIITRIKEGNPEKTHEYQMKTKDAFSKLVKVYRTQHNYSNFKKVGLEYNGEKLDEDSSPDDNGMLDKCIVEIVDEAQRLKQVAHMPRSSATISGSSGDGGNSDNASLAGLIQLKFRINGDPKSIHNLGLLPKEKFQVVMDKFFTKNLLTKEECKFHFDGDVLSPMGSPDDEDLEGGEIIDVKVTKKETTTPTVSPSTSSSSGNAIARNNGRQPAQIQQMPPTQADPPQVIQVQTLRNNTTGRPKKFRLNSTDSFQKLREGYVKYYKSKGCRSVRFYFKNNLMNMGSTFRSVGVKDMDTIVAMENARKFV